MYNVEAVVAIDYFFRYLESSKYWNKELLEITVGNGATYIWMQGDGTVATYKKIYNLNGPAWSAESSSRWYKLCAFG